MNTAQIISLLIQVQHLIHGHHFHTFVVPGCYEYVRVSTSHPEVRRLVCGTIEVGQRFIKMSWG